MCVSGTKGEYKYTEIIMKAKQNTKVKILALAQNFTTDMQKWKARGKRDKYTNKTTYITLDNTDCMQL